LKRPLSTHAGGIGTVGVTGAPSECMGYVFGTSSCTMTTTAEPVFEARFAAFERLQAVAREIRRAAPAP
jgi:hypothetical protein